MGAQPLVVVGGGVEGEELGALGLPRCPQIHHTSPAAPLPGDSLIGGLRQSTAPARDLQGNQLLSPAPPTRLGGGDRATSPLRT